MFGLGLLGFSLLINVGMVAANSGLCPGYPKVSPRDKTCFITPNCKKDSDCVQIRGKSRKSQKCCENPCGVTLCQDVDPVKAKLRELEKCPAPRLSVESPSCIKEPTKFCYK
eukprot:UN27163